MLRVVACFLTNIRLGFGAQLRVESIERGCDRFVESGFRIGHPKGNTVRRGRELGEVWCPHRIEIIRVSERDPPMRQLGSANVRHGANGFVGSLGHRISRKTTKLD